MLTEGGIIENSSACKGLMCEQNWMLFPWVVTQFRLTVDALQLDNVTAWYVVRQITKHNAVNLRNEKQLHPEKEHSFVTCYLPRDEQSSSHFLNIGHTI
jgi:hypothetical protein